MKAHTHIIVVDNFSYIGEDYNPIFLQQVQKSIDPLEKTICILIDHTKNNSLHSTIQSLSINAECISLKTISFFGFLNIRLTTRNLKKILSQYSAYRITAHGTIASAVTRRCAEPLTCNAISLKIYGLLAAEYEWHINNKKKSFGAFYQYLKLWHYQTIEKKVFTQKTTGIKTSIETISNALKEFIFNSYNGEYHAITVMESSLSGIEDSDKSACTIIRNELNVQSDATIYCIDASKKTVDLGLAIDIFKKELTFIRNAYVLIVSNDQHIHELMLAHSISSAWYHIINTAQFKSSYSKIVDIGIIVRDHHIAHWVSKPSDALLYIQSGIPIVHNNTIAWLAKEHDTKEFFAPQHAISKQKHHHETQ